MRTVICAALLCSLTAFSVAQEQPNSQDKQDAQAFAVYEETFRLGKELFLANYMQDIPVIRIAALLRVCGQDGLAKAVEAKQKDPQFNNELTKTLEGRFHGLPSYAVLSVQNIANGMRLGYAIGYREAAEQHGQADPSFQNQSLCGKGADEILKR